MKEAPLRKALLFLGVSANEIDSYRSLKLLGVLLALQTIARDQGFDLVPDFASIVKQWQPNSTNNALKPLLALNELRQLDSHPKGTDFDKKLRNTLAIFGVSLNETANGWGLALDKIYDVIAQPTRGNCECS